MRKFIITSIIFIITLLSACGKKENPIEILKPTEIEQKTSGIYEIETIDFNIGERNIDDINYSLKGIISIPKEPKQKKLKVAIIVPGYYKDIKSQDKGFRYLTEYIAKNGYLGISIDTYPAYYLKHTVDKEYENIPKIVDEHIKMLKESNEGNNIYDIDLKNKTIFVTGSAGFIGSNLVLELLRTQSPINIIGLDNMNDYYDVNIKEWRLQEIKKCVSEHSDSTYVFYKDDLADKTVIDKIFAEHKPDIVVNLGAQAGVRYSITNPDAYIQSNMIGFYNILEACRHSYDNGCKGVDHLVYASSSSVYGTNKKVPYSTEDKVDNPVSLYAATKKSNELMAHAYSKLYNIPSTGLRFFTVYGPAGRPDMAYFGFTNKLIKGDTIQIFNYGNCKRDFTYIDDIVEGVKRVMQGAPEKKNGEDGLPIPPYAVYNIGNSNPENLLDFVTILQEELLRAEVLPADYDFESHKQLVAMQPGDVPVTFADTSALERDYGFKPNTSLRTGLRRFAQWYKEFYQV